MINQKMSLDVPSSKITALYVFLPLVFRKRTRYNRVPRARRV